MKKLTTAQIEKIWDEHTAQGKSIFVRWSRGPRYDKKPSRDYANGGTHAGVSCVMIEAWADEYLFRRLNEYCFLRMKDPKIAPYIYTGEILGTDSDGYESVSVDSLVCLGKWDEK